MSYYRYDTSQMSTLSISSHPGSNSPTGRLYLVMNERILFSDIASSCLLKLPHITHLNVSRLHHFTPIFMIFRATDQPLIDALFSLNLPRDRSDFSINSSPSGILCA